MLNESDHWQLVFIASRLGLEVRQCCGEHQLNDQLVTDSICQACREGHDAQIWGVHSQGQCQIKVDDEDRLCLVEHYRQRIKKEGGFLSPYNNTLLPWERDYIVYTLARRTNQLTIFHDILSNIRINCDLCRQGCCANLAPNIHEAGDCAGEYDPQCENEDIPEGELAKKCWLDRAYWWFHDGYRLSYPHDRV